MSSSDTESIVVVGLGYVGLPLSVAFAESGQVVVGLDLDADRVSALNCGRSYIDDIPDARLRPVVESKNFRATTDPDYLHQASAIIVCVPTPLTKHRTPDLTAVLEATRTVASRLKLGQLIVLESTTYPGTTEELVRPILEESGLTVGRDFFLAFSPERIDPGSTTSGGITFRTTPKIVGGITPRCAARAQALYERVVDRVVTVSSPQVAELAKLFENIFRNVNIALVNELSILCDRMDIDVWEVIDAASTKPFGFMRFTPGPGVGGHCIPVDPFYLTWKAREYGVHTRFIELAGEINENMPHFVVRQVAKALNRQHKSVGGAKVLALGVAYKANISDTRESPALKVIEELLAGGAEITYHDPHVPKIQVAGRMFQSVPIGPDLIAEADCVVVLTNHASIDFDLVSQHARMIVDTRRCVPTRVTEGAQV